jgi:cytochrome b involved in lipid metabolism
MIKAVPLLFLIFMAIACGGHAFLLPTTSLRPTIATVAITLRYRNGTVGLENADEDPKLRFERVAASTKAVDEPCILGINGNSYNMTAWAKAHPGGSQILAKFHNKDATKAFYATGHSHRAIEMLDEFLIDEKAPATATEVTKESSPVANLTSLGMGPLARARNKLFTQEDPVGIHKYSGVFVLLHFAFRYLQTWFGDPSAGFGTRMGEGSSILPLFCLIPHTLLSLSSLIFHTVPRERIVGRPMIWQEFRAHNIIFGLRSIISTLFAWMAIHSRQSRRLAVAGSSCTVLAAMAFADIATSKLRENTLESTTATMPYWEGCSVKTQKRIKSFYAYSQFMATMACSKYRSKMTRQRLRRVRLVTHRTIYSACEYSDHMESSVASCLLVPNPICQFAYDIGS